eukprot:scaffold9792_cov39-Phaeocystis_antarctica.AAC.1
MALAGGSLHSTCVLRCCGAYFSLDAAWPPVCCIPPLQIFCKFGPESGISMKHIWGPSNRNSGRGQGAARRAVARPPTRWRALHQVAAVLPAARVGLSSEMPAI